MAALPFWGVCQAPMLPDIDGDPDIDGADIFEDGFSAVSVHCNDDGAVVDAEAVWIVEGTAHFYSPYGHDPSQCDHHQGTSWAWWLALYAFDTISGEVFAPELSPLLTAHYFALFGPPRPNNPGCPWTNVLDRRLVCDQREGIMRNALGDRLDIYHPINE